jgi:hypothetical protein
MDEAKGKKLLSFLETAAFIERLAELAGDRQMELLYAIQDELLADPKRVYIFDKREKADLNDAERKILSSIADRLKHDGNKGKL